MKRLYYLLVVICALMLQSCDFYDIGKKDFRLELPEPSETPTTVEALRYNSPYGMAGGKMYPLEVGMKARPIAWQTFDQGHDVLTLMGDGYQMAIYSNMLADDGSVPGDLSINTSFRHYDRTDVSDLIGKTPEAVADQWGDYTYKVPIENEEATVSYVYPYIKLLQKSSYYEGVMLYVGPEGVVTDVRPLSGVHSNAFGHLPFYEKILSMNIMEWIMPGLWIDRNEDTPSRGVFFSIIYSLLLFGIVVAAVCLICWLLYLPVELWLTSVRFYGGALIFAGAFCVEYIAMISLLDYYSAAWWVTVLFLLVWSVMPLQVLGLSAREFCPDCKASSWGEEEKKITHVELPKMSFDLKWQGGSPKLVPASSADVEITYHTEKRCRKCGHIRESDYSTTVHRDRSICPRCFRDTVSGRFTKFDYYDNTLDVEYEEKCSCCGYKQIHTVNRVLKSCPSNMAQYSRSRNGGATRPAGEHERRMSEKCAFNAGESTCTLGEPHRCKYFASGLPMSDCPYFRKG